MNTTVAAVDIGYSEVKYISSVRGNRPVAASFRSAAKQVASLEKSFVVPADADVVQVLVGSKRFAVGPDAYRCTGLSWQPEPGQPFVASDEYLALALAALCWAGQPAIGRLAIGVPRTTSNHDIERLRWRLRGQHTVIVPPSCRYLASRDSISIDEVVVYGQPEGAFIHHMRLLPHARLDQTTTFVLDCGYRTINFLLAERKKLWFGRSGAIEGGMAEAFGRLDLAVRADLATHDHDVGPCVDLQRYADALRQPGAPLETACGLISLERFKPQLRQAIELQLESVMNTVGDLMDAQNVVVTGGGAHLAGRALQRRGWPAQRIFMDAKNLTTANVLGMYAHALERQEEQSGEVA